MTARRRPLRSAGLAVLASALLLATAACGSGGSTATGSPPTSAIPTPGTLNQQSYDQMQAKVSSAASAVSAADSDATSEVTGTP